MTPTLKIGMFFLGYALLANALALVMLQRKGIPLSVVFAGTPGYLAKICLENRSKVGFVEKFLAISAVPGLVAAIVLMFWGGWGELLA